MIVDLHCHSHYSDGSLSPESLIKLAEENKIEIFSITDHDNVDAYKDLKNIDTDVKIIPGIEFSTSWNKIGVHIIGLHIDPQSKDLINAIDRQKTTRQERAHKIAERLEKHGLKNAIEKIKGNDEYKQIGRPDFASLLIKERVVVDWNQAFKKYLGAGKLGDIKNNWLSLDEVIAAIKASGGIAVLAHPLYYKLTNSKLRRLIVDFKSMGGMGIEVVNGYQNSQKTNYLRQLCMEFKLKASIGSDFHHPTKWHKLGCQSSMVLGVDTVW
jgi:predicted metal-dependent phosphoesterase TrpH